MSANIVACFLPHLARQLPQIRNSHLFVYLVCKGKDTFCDLNMVCKIWKPPHALFLGFEPGNCCCPNKPLLLYWWWCVSKNNLKKSCLALLKPWTNRFIMKATIHTKLYEAWKGLCISHKNEYAVSLQNCSNESHIFTHPRKHTQYLHIQHLHEEIPQNV